MLEQGSSHTAGVLDPTIPVDIGARSQRQRIIEAMIESCAEKTYAATTIADIVKRAGISRTTFYKRFPNKRACFDGALAFCLDALREAAVESYGASDPPPQALRKAAAAMLELLAARPAMAQLVMGDAIMVEPAIGERYREWIVSGVAGLWEATDPPRPFADPGLAFGRAQVLVFSQIAAGRADRLPELLPEIVYIALLPLAGHEEAVQQAQIAGDHGSNGSAPR
ncbi:MAG TPA: TetR/AcrR family transcriptional regulator [Solirubrobacterales bacterium]|nr:TetR/AcrR family transcriptional regulator [Solirubrobacterales bacterium]